MLMLCLLINNSVDIYWSAGELGNYLVNASIFLYMFTRTHLIGVLYCSRVNTQFFSKLN